MGWQMATMNYELETPARRIAQLSLGQPAVFAQPKASPEQPSESIWPGDLAA